MPTKFSYHPIFTDLRINEDGSEAYLKGVLLRQAHDKSRRCELRYFLFNLTVPAAKLVLESFVGMRENISLQVKRKDGDRCNIHYTNLEWGKPGVRHYKPKKLAPITEKAIEMVKTGKTNKEICDTLDMDRRRLHTIKSKYINGKKK